MISSYFDLFRQQAGQFPESRALAQQDRFWTYGELLQKAIQFSSRFRSIYAPTIGFMRDRSMEMVAAMPGAWCAGKSFVHIDPTYPSEFNRVLLTEANIHCVIADGANGLAAAGLTDFAIQLENDGELPGQWQKCGVSVDFNCGHSYIFAFAPAIFGQYAKLIPAPLPV